jgi:diguanylate cyclase (GGDEF)-like protein
VPIRTGGLLLRSRLRALRGQAVAHIFLAMLIATVGLVGIAIKGYDEFRTREIDQKFESLRGYYGDQLVRVEYAWKNAAEQLRTRLEFMRILEQQDSKRWPKFTAFLNAQRVFGEFPTLLVLGGDGRILYRYGVIAHALSAENIRVGEWHFETSLGELYRVFREPVWLGTEGQGTLVMLKPLDNSTLKALVIPEFSLAARWEDEVVAVSRDDYPDALADDAAQVVSIGTQQLVQARLEWPGTEEQRPVLLAYRELHDILPFREFMYWLLGALGFITLLLWLALGQWLSRTVRRLESVDQALDAYADQAPHDIVQQHLAAARSRQDEINNLTDAISELVQAVETREREQAGYLETLALLEEAVLELDCDGLIRHASPGWSKLAHCDNAVGRNLLEFIHPDDTLALHAQCAILRSGEKNHLLFRVRLAGPNPEQQSWIECRFLGFHDEHGEVSGIRGVLRDITQSYLHEKQISHMALHDALTGLPNRVLLEDRLKIALRMATRYSDKVCVCFIDIDHFKNVNDTLGHKAGDRLLVAFANLLRGELRAGDTLARWGGDEFVLLLPGMLNEQNVREVTLKITAVIQQPLLLDGVEMRMTFSLGAAIYPDDAENSEVLFSQADRAMFYAKAQGRNQCCFFGDMTTKGIGKKELYVQNRLATAINAGQIQAWFQPIVCARSDACVGVEVLARWQDDELGWISPATFIPIAENIGLIRELGEQVWQASLAMQEYCRAAKHKLRFSVNVSKRQLFIPSFTERAIAELALRGIPIDEIMWEVTESVALRDVEHAAERLHELKAAGFKIAIDDFGTGYSSLSQLHEIHADELKIDISFVRRIHEPAGLSLVQAIIHIARALGLHTVAEGVEDAAAADALRELGVDYLQGYHFARPMPREDFLRWLENHQAQTEPTRPSH